MISRSGLIFTRGKFALLYLLLLGALSACVSGAGGQVASMTEVGSGETLIVGSVELVPPLIKDEQKIQGLNSGMYENILFLLSDDKYRVLNEEPGMGDYTIEAVLGKDFYVRSSSDKHFFILAGMLYLELGGSATNRAYFPGGLKALIKPGDKAVYVGTVQYHRDEFFVISKVTVVDDYDRANAEYKKKFGAQYSLRKALLTQVK